MLTLKVNFPQKKPILLATIKQIAKDLRFAEEKQELEAIDNRITILEEKMKVLKEAINRLGKSRNPNISLSANASQFIPIAENSSESEKK